MGSLFSRCYKEEDKMVGEDFEVEIRVEVTQKSEPNVVENAQKKEPEKKLSDVLLERMEESESLTEFVDRVCSAVSDPNGGLNLVAIMIHACVQSILRAEIKELTEEMVKYRTLLSRKMRETPKEELDLQATFNIEKLKEGFEAGWRLLKQGEEEKAIFEAFMTTMNIRLPDVVPESPGEREEPSEDDGVSLVAIMIHCCVQSILHAEIKQLALEMLEYRNLLSRKMLATPEEELNLHGTLNLEKLERGFEAGWRSLKHGCGEDAAFDAFMTKMDVRLPEKDTTQSQ